MKPHDALAELLAHHLHHDARIILTNVAVGSRIWEGKGIPVPDVYAFNKSYSAPNFCCYEIKVSRSDFLKDKRTGKYKKYFKISDKVYFVTPKGLIKKDEVPNDCGFIEYNEDKKNFRTVKVIPTPRRDYRKKNDDNILISKMALMSIIFAIHDTDPKIRRLKEVSWVEENERMRNMLNSMYYKDRTVYNELKQALRHFKNLLYKYKVKI